MSCTNFICKICFWPEEGISCACNYMCHICMFSGNKMYNLQQVSNSSKSLANTTSVYIK